MPGGDRTGPAGLGPMTGRAAGYCAGNPGPGFSNPIPGRGFGGRGGGRGRGRGWGRSWGWPGWGGYMGYPAFGGDLPYGAPVAQAITKDQELEALKGQAEYFQEALDGIRKRIEELQDQSE